MRFNDSELIKELTKEWTGERFEDGRPKVRDQLLKRLAHVTTEAAYIAMVETVSYTHLVTGSGKGLGGSLAIEAAKHGAQVVLHYNSSVKSAQKVLEQVRAYGVPAILVPVSYTHLDVYKRQALS